MTAKDADDYPDQVPEGVVAEAKAAFARKADGDLAHLVHDSLIDGDDAAADHRLRFEHPQMLIDLQVSAAADTSSVTGHINPPARRRAQIESDRAGASSTACIEEGVFTFRDVPHGIVRIILLATGDDPPIHTDWFRI